jgi:hypothetical protein
MGRNAKYLAAAIAVVLAAGSPALAQPSDSKACTDQERGNQTLSEKLGQTNGVICPPDIDAGMQAPTPEEAAKRRLSRLRGVLAATRMFDRNSYLASLTLDQITYCRNGG